MSLYVLLTKAVPGVINMDVRTCKQEPDVTALREGGEAQLALTAISPKSCAESNMEPAGGGPVQGHF